MNLHCDVKLITVVAKNTVSCNDVHYMLVAR